MSEAKPTDNWNSYDILKFLSSLLVVGIHTKPFDGMGVIDYGFGFISRFPVPVFFLLSGFFLFNDDVSTAKVIRYCTRIFSMYAVWAAIYSMLGIDSENSFLKIIAGGTPLYGFYMDCL